MAITFPRTFPTEWKHGRTDFKLIRRQSTSPTWGGRNQVSELGPAVWYASYETTLLSRVALRACLSWLDSLQGGMKTFYGHDPAFPFPASDSPAGPATIGTPIIGSWSVADSTVGAYSATVGFQIKAGDYVAFDYPAAGGETHRALHRIVEDQTVNGSGVFTALTVQPRILSGLAGGESCVFTRPAAEMRILADTIKTATDENGFGRVGFEAVQVIRV